MIAKIKGFRRYKAEQEEMHPPAHEHSAPEMPSDIGLPDGVTISRTALVFPTDFAMDDWVELGEKLSALETGVQWWVGDWWHYGNHTYGDRKKQVEKHARRLFGYKFETLMNYGSVAEVPTSLRSEVLSRSPPRLGRSLSLSRG